MKKIIFGIILLSFFGSCKKDSNKPILSGPIKVNNIIYPQVFYFGEGRGDLTIDGASISIPNSSLVVIKSGIYSSIKIINLQGVTVQNGDGEVKIEGQPNTEKSIEFVNSTISYNLGIK